VSETPIRAVSVVEQGALADLIVELRSAMRVMAPGPSSSVTAAESGLIYSHLGTSQPVGVILDEIAVDPACVFWG
jgi:hypothetical protein